MDSAYMTYLALLDEVSGILEHLSELAQRKAAAVRADDLISLEQVLKQEQALSLNLRGLEQKRGSQLAQLGLAQTPLSALVAAYPKHLQMRAKQSVERLQQQYAMYRGAAEVARNTLECNLHEIEKVIAALSGDSVNGPGYMPPSVEPPRAMKTDFRA